jgi:hypothetical protein
MAMSVAILSACNERPPQKSVFEAPAQALKKARAVEDTLKDAAAQEREKIEQQEGAPAPSN